MRWLMISSKLFSYAFKFLDKEIFKAAEFESVPVLQKMNYMLIS